MDDPEDLAAAQTGERPIYGRRVLGFSLSIEQLCDALIVAACEHSEYDFVRGLAAPLCRLSSSAANARRATAQRDMFLKLTDDDGGLSSKNGRG